jgi:hypothetical protein
LENQEITFKNLFIVGLLVLGLFAWTKVEFSFSFERIKNFQSPVSFEKTFERNPTALKNMSVEKVFVQKPLISGYTPNLKVFDTKRTEAPLNIVQDNKEASELPSEALKTNEFEATRNEVTFLMASGKFEDAVELAKARLEENIVSSKDTAFMGYLQDFIMQNIHDPEEQYSLTYASVKNAQDSNVRKQLIEKFSTYQPGMAEEMKQDMKASGVSI